MIIARLHSDFPTKFGLPRQSGLVDALESTVVFERSTASARRCAALRNIRTYGSCGCFPNPAGNVGSLRFVRRAWAETSAWGYLPRALRSA
jgi:hypothetical protein